MPGFASLAEPWWIPVLTILVFGHLTNLCVTLYLHRSATHEGVVFHPVISHLMRFWLWLTTGMVTRQWVAVHRKHHAFSDREGDPHSPAQEGLAEIVFGGVFFYREAVKDEEMLQKYGKGCPDDWIERKVYTRIPFVGVVSMLVLDLVLFGPAWGLVVWTSMAIWIPVMGNVINGVGHAIGYRNFDTKDQSHNIIPLGLWIVGEELHNNHHADPRSAKFRARWFEFDIGWVYIRVLSALRLANVLYARDVSAAEFRERYYRRATSAAASAGAAAREVVEDARSAALEAVGDAKTAALEVAHAASTRAREAAQNAGAAANRAAATAFEAAQSASAAANRAAATAREAAQAAGAAIQANKSLPVTD
jgi:stearoyl-CoA desaturase (delta-9 desaturase)